MRTWPVVIPVALVLAGCQPAKDEWKYPSSLESVLPALLQERIQTGDRVEARLISLGSVDAADEPGRCVAVRGGGAYHWRTAPVLLSAAQTERLRALLLNRSSYQTLRKTNTFDPTIHYRIFTGPDTVEVLVCHGGAEVLAWSRGVHGLAEIDPAELQFLGLTRELFPQDTDIADLWYTQSKDPPQPY